MIRELASAAHLLLISHTAVGGDFPLLYTDFENFDVGPGELLSQEEISAYCYGSAFPLSKDDPTIQGVTTIPGFNGSRVGYLGGSQSGQLSSVNAGSFYGIAAYQSQPTETSDVFARDLQSEGFKSLSASIDFYIERGSSNVSQTIAIYLYDAEDVENAETGLVFGSIYIQEDDSVVIYDSSLTFIPTPSSIVVTPQTPYRLTYRVDYSTNLWWASLTQLASGTVEVLASRRNHPANGFINPNGVIDIALETKSAAAGNFGDDRVYFDNFKTYISTSSAEELDMSLSDHSGGKMKLTSPTLPGLRYQLRRGNQVNALEPSGPQIEGTGEVLVETIDLQHSQEFFQIIQTAD